MWRISDTPRPAQEKQRIQKAQVRHRTTADACHPQSILRIEAQLGFKKDTEKPEVREWGRFESYFSSKSVRLKRSHAPYQKRGALNSRRAQAGARERVAGRLKSI